MDHGDLGSTREPVAMDTGGMLGFFLASGSSAPVGIEDDGGAAAWTRGFVPYSFPIQK